MAKIEGFRIKNFRALKDLTLGRLWNQQQVEPLTPMTAVIVAVADKIPNNVLGEDPKLFMWYDQAATRMGYYEGQQV